MVDIHCHMLPGVDDGPGDWPESMALARLFVKAGIQKAIITPHFIPGVYRCDIEAVSKIHEQFKKKLDDEGLNLETYLAAEVGIIAELPEWIAEGRVPLMPTGKHLLLEAPMFGGSALMRDMTFAVLSMGITPIIAHPERSPLFMELKLAEDIVATEGELQVNAGSIIGRWGPAIKKLAVTLIDRGLVHYVASDSHGPRKRPPHELVTASKEVEKIWGRAAKETLFEGRGSNLYP